MAKLISFFGSRVEKTIRSWPSSTKEAICHYLDLCAQNINSDERLNARMTDQPYWILLPLWLAERLSPGKRHTFSKRFMDDILWAQYCLFVFIRMQDDLFDRHTQSLPLIYAADGFLLEANRVFLQYFPSASPFWGIYRTSIGETIFAVADADEMHRGLKRNNARLLSQYGKTSSICNVASAAVCLKAGKPGIFSRVTLFSREFMMTGAILDDLIDMQEDVVRGRFNYAASYFLPRNTILSEKKKNLLWIQRNFQDEERFSGLFREMYRHLDLAEKTLSSFMVPSAKEYIRLYRRVLHRKEDFMHWQKTNRILKDE